MLKCIEFSVTLAWPPTKTVNYLFETMSLLFAYLLFVFVCTQYKSHEDELQKLVYFERTSNYMINYRLQ